MVCKLKFNYNIYRITTNSNTNSRRHPTLPATFSNTSNLQVLKEIRDWYGVCDDSQPSLECTHYAGVSFIVCLYMRTAVQSKILIQLRQKPLYTLSKSSAPATQHERVLNTDSWRKYLFFKVLFQKKGKKNPQLYFSLISSINSMVGPLSSMCDAMKNIFIIDCLYPGSRWRLPQFGNRCL